ncbi:MAG: hypothetical protein ACRETW_10505 [Stenotrophobium sp.]
MKASTGKIAAVTLSALVAAGNVGCYSSGSSNYNPPPPSTPILNSLSTITTLGSTLDPQNGDQNPYGLAIAPISAGLIAAGDLVVCNFNDGPTNTQGLGTTIIGLHPDGHSMPYRIAQSASLKGCSEIALLPDDSIAAAANQANDNPVVTPNGSVTNPFAADTFSGPWGETYVAYLGTTALYVSNTGTGVIDRISLMNGQQTAFTEIVTGFSVNHGVPGSILAPAGLTYNSANDTLYVVDSNQNRVVALSRVSQIGMDGVVVSGAGFSGPSAASASVIASGAPLNGPLSAALLVNGDLVVGNTLDPTGTNLLIEVSPTAGVVATRNVDTGAGAALFGIAASGTSAANQVIYFNDDNDNTVKKLSN